MTTEEIIEDLNTSFEKGELLFADGFEDALLGTAVGAGRAVACYDYDKCIEILMTRDDMDEESAIEFFEFNTIGANMGTKTPLYLHNMRAMESDTGAF